MQEFQFRAMNSEIVFLAEGRPDQAAAGFEAAQGFIQAGEARFTRFSEHSELSRLNRSSGSWFKASPDLFELIREALFHFHQTGGLFDPAILPDLRRAGYDRSLDELRRGTPIGTRSQPLSRANGEAPTFDMIELDGATCSIRLPAGLQVDLGGLAKGWIAEGAARRLSEHSKACAVSAGGDMFLIGLPAGRDFWEVGLEDPRAPNDDITVLQVQAGAVATSSVAKRVWQQGAATRHHLIDPRTHEPAETDWLSVTVLAPHMGAAEAFAKAALIGGMHRAKLISAQNPGLTLLAVDRDGRLINLQENEHVHS